MCTVLAIGLLLDTTGYGASHSVMIPEQIQKYYADHEEKVVKVTEYGKYNSYLVEWKAGSTEVPDRYDWWNASSQQPFNIPSGPYFIKNVTVINDRDVRLLASGVNDSDSYTAFPFVIHCWRPDNQSQFQATNEPYYLHIMQSVKIGGQKVESLYDIKVTVDGIEMAFGPIKGKMGDYDAGSTLIPITTTHFDPKTHIFTVLLRNTHLEMPDPMGSERNQFIKSVSVLRADNDTQVNITLTKSAEFYNAAMRDILNSLAQPCLTLTFGTKSYGLVVPFNHD